MRLRLMQVRCFKVGKKFVTLPQLVLDPVVRQRPQHRLLWHRPCGDQETPVSQKCRSDSIIVV